MSKGRQTFKQGDVTKAIKATVKAGLHVEKVEITEDGRIIVHIEENNKPKPAPGDWD
jgi:hypothetical protein